SPRSFTYVPPSALSSLSLHDALPIYVSVHQSRFEGLGVERDGLGLDLDGPVDVLPLSAVDGELLGEGGGEGDVVPALVGIRRGHLCRRERLAGLRGGDRVSVTEIPVIAGGDRAHRDGSAEQLSLESLDLGLRIEDVDHPDGEPARLRPRARDRG